MKVSPLKDDFGLVGNGSQVEILLNGQYMRPDVSDESVAKVLHQL